MAICKLLKKPHQSFKDLREKHYLLSILDFLAVNLLQSSIRTTASYPHIDLTQRK